MNIDFSGTTVLITGGSRGIGRSLTKAFAERGSNVHFTYLNNDEAARNLESELKNYQVKAHCVDGRNEEEVRDFLASLINSGTKVNTLINNAGIVPRSLLAKCSSEQWNNTMNSNIYSSFLYSKGILKLGVAPKNRSGYAAKLRSRIYSLGDFIFKPLCGAFSL